MTAFRVATRWKALLLLLSLFQVDYCLADNSKDRTAVSENNGKQQDEKQCADDTAPKCGLWLAKSTIPDSGLGMFAGKEFKDNEELLETGDIVIPIVDFEMNQIKYRYKSLWDEYTWEAGGTLMDHEGFVEVNAASPGFGACANSYLDLQNVQEWRPFVDDAGLDRFHDPGAGASSAYYNRRSTAKGDIQAGQELFVSYGTDWFEHRARLGPIPLAGDHRKGQFILERYRRIQNRLDNLTHVLKDAWERFVWQSPYKNESRLLNALPQTWEDMDFAMNKSLLDMRKKKHTVTQEWLDENGRCMDNMRVDQSTLSQAGRGAFATRFLSKGTVVAPVPLIHVPHKERLVMYDVDVKKKNNKTIYEADKLLPPIGKQLLTNYCYGHPKSTLLLCPYGVMTAAINHNQTQANLKMQWGDPKRTNHHPDWLQLSVQSLIKETKSGLAMELVATRDIEPGEELFLDYGNEWEQAWQEHVKDWRPPDPRSGYANRTASQLNADVEKNIRTVYELIHDPYPITVMQKCELCFRWRPKWKNYIGNHTALVEYIRSQDDQQQECELLRRDNVNGTVTYTANLIEIENGVPKVASKMENIPIEAFLFVDRAYESNMFLPGAFRHSIMIPDEIFPDKWKNEVNETDT